jgi:hypothetical protein
VKRSKAVFLVVFLVLLGGMLASGAILTLAP